MLAASETTKLVLPLGEVDIEELCATDDLASWSSFAKKQEIAAALLVLMLPKLKSNGAPKSNLIENMLADLVESTKSDTDLQRLKSKLCSSWSKEQFQTGLALLQENGIALLGESDDEFQQQMLESDSWDFEISRQILSSRDPFLYEVNGRGEQDVKLTDPQYRIALKVIGEVDEDLDVQGYAGVGKTHLIDVFLSLLSSSGFTPLLLTFTKNQLQALKGRLSGDPVEGMTFGQLAIEILVESGIFSRSDLYERSASNYQVSNKQIAQWLGLHSIGRLEEVTVADIARRTVSSYCMTRDEDIHLHHLPKMTDNLTQLEKSELIAASQRLWRETVSPSTSEIRPPIRGYHQIKQASLMGAVVPERFTHVIVDESHELTGPLLSIFDQSPAAIITMGDKFQHLGGFAAERANTVRRNSINLSVRAGSQFESVANPILEKHPRWNDLPLLGSALRRTEVIYYDRPALPEIPTAILCGTEWDLIEWFQRLSHQNAKFSILPGSYYSFKGLMEGCIELYSEGKRSRHPFLFRYPTWESLSSAQGNNDAFCRIERMLQKGYSMMDLERSLSRLQPPGTGQIILGLVEHAKNMEFNAVMLTPEVMKESTKQTRRSGARMLANLYTGASRAKHALYIPGDLTNWLQDVSLK